MSIRGRLNLRRSLLVAGSFFLVASGAALAVRAWWPSAWARARARLSGERTVSDVVDRIGPRVRPELRRAFHEAGGCAYPPARLVLIALKEERILEAWAPDPDGRMRAVGTYPVLGASGGPGPKLREGDRQVPEGFYRAEGLNPNSAFYLSIRLDYPNDFDRRMAERDGRSNPGGDIFVHGRTASIGCLAMGDPAVEELFLMVCETGLQRVEVLIAPVDFRKRSFAPPPGAPPWTGDLYARLAGEMGKYSPARSASVRP